ncbi:class IV lanthionine synthetase LanL [Kitasatospora sp. NPDC056138]|uniref:class IV lanthionine synthetase LanL n=1 Tax=Kitasatospora sp. NPDC056138 TaxID=3345724 RepID=UPI0035DFDC9E
MNPGLDNPPAAGRAAGLRGPGHERPEDASLLTDVVRAVIARHGTGEEDGWTVDPQEFWCYVRPRGVDRRAQGWKLHVSATPLAAAVTLARAAEVLIAHGANFKFAGTLNRVTELVSARYARGGGGKFITVYPNDDEQFRLLAEELHRATVGLPGPAVLSDRRYLPDSQVHYRYGVFHAAPRLTNDGSYASRLTDPDGRPVPDERNAWFSPPPWAENPFPDREPTPPLSSAALRPVLLNDRYLVRGAIRHANKGGVYRAEDGRTGEQVIVKQARAHVGATVEGLDVRDLLRREAAMLDRFSRQGVAPRVVEVFEQQGSVLLVQESVPGASLRRTVARRLSETGHACADDRDAAVLVEGLIGLVAAAHGEGVTLNDFNPNNVMVTPDGRLLLIDLEMAAREGERWVLGATPGYAAPELLATEAIAPCLPTTVDLYALGATVLHALSGADPLLAEDHPEPRPTEGRVAALVGLLARDHAPVRRFAPLVLGLMRDEPKQRWSLDRAREFLTARPVATAQPEPPDASERLLVDGIGHLVATMRPDAERLWRSDDFGETCDPVAVQHGSAGVLAVLARALGTLGDRDGLEDAVRTAAQWTLATHETMPSRLPGIHFGRSGTAWALHDAALALDDADLAERAVDLALELPVRWPNPDVCHGAAGSGLTQLHFWRATGDPRFLARAQEAAQGLLEAARRVPEGVFWPVPDDFDSALAGVWHYGFAHGVAGVGTFLLAVGEAVGDERLLAAAVEAGQTLATAARTGPAGAMWPVDRERHLSADPAPVRYWCSGSSGVGTFLVRLWQHTGDRATLGLVEQAARAVVTGRAVDSTAACHGLTGNAEFLLDAADLTGEAHYRERAGLLVDHIAVQGVLRDGRLVVPDESRLAVLAEYSTGLAGAVALMLRLRHGGPRMWLPESAPALVSRHP